MGVFMRAPGDTDQHTLLLCHRPDRAGINHCAFEVARVDEVIVGANHMIEQGWREARRLGRHTVGSNIFRFIHAPCGGRVEFAADMDRVDDSYGPNDHEETPPHHIWPLAARSETANEATTDRATAELPRDQALHRRRVDARAGGRGDDVVNPATEEVIGQVPFAEPDDVDARDRRGRRALPAWRDAGPEDRAAILRKAAALLHQRADDIGRVMTLEEGKPLTEAGARRTGPPRCEWDARRAAAPTGGSSRPARRVLSVRRDPVGPVGAFVPWNFPAGGPMRKIAAALSAGCTIVIKPSEEVPATRLRWSPAFDDAGLPAGVLNMVFGVPDEISAQLIADPAIRFVAFTGSVPVGKHIAGARRRRDEAGIMELGGHAPVIVCADTDPVAAARTAVRAKVANAGQVCTSPSRFFVHRTSTTPSSRRSPRRWRAIKVGNGLERACRWAAGERAAARAGVQRLVADAVERGRDGRAPAAAVERPGFFYPADRADRRARRRRAAAARSRSARSLRSTPFDDLDEALEVANALPYGLAAYGFTDSAATAETADRRASRPASCPSTTAAARCPRRRPAA